MKGYPSAREEEAMKMPSPMAHMVINRINRDSSRERGEGAGWRRAARPATRPSAVRSPQHKTTPVKLLLTEMKSVDLKI